MPEVSNILIQKNHFDKLPDNRKTIMYREAVKIAQMIILNYSPDIISGRENMLALLFDMDQLWEEYIYRMLLKSKSENFKISYQNSKVFWKTNSFSKTIRPDLVIQFSNQDKKENYIIDTKWKIIDYHNPGDDDLKQMYAYNMYWDAGRSMLLYPGTSNFPELWGIFPKGSDYENRCKIGFINVLDEEAKGLNINIGREILKKLEVAVV